MKFSDNEIDLLIADIENLLEEFDTMSQDERAKSAAMEQDVRSIHNRLSNYKSLDDDERKTLHVHIYKLYDFLDEYRSEEEITEQLEGINKALESVEETSKGQSKEEFGTMHEITEEMARLANALAGPEKLGHDELQAIERELEKLEKKFKDNYLK